jgi:hypothetical protein
MQKKFLGLIAAGGVVFLSGCQTMPYQPYARNVKVEPQSGGVVALKLEHQDEDRAKAQSMMANNCGGQAVKVLEEGETVIGTETSSKETNDAGSNGTRVGSLFGIPVTSGAKEASKNTATVTTNKKEWQIRYKCIASSESKRVVR